MSFTEKTDYMYEQSGFVPEILHETGKAKLAQFRKINENRMVLLLLHIRVFYCLLGKERDCLYLLGNDS